MHTLSYKLLNRALFQLTVSISTVAILLTVAMVTPAEAQKTRNVLVLHSYHQGLQWTDRISEGIESVLRVDRDDIELHYEYLDTKRNPGELYFNRLIEFETLKTQLAHIDFDLILSSDNNALRFIIEYGDRLFPGVPVVFCGVNDFQRSMLKGKKDITGVVEAIDYRLTLDLMHRFHPRRDRILVILDRTPTGAAIKREFDKVTAGMGPQFTFEFYQDFLLDEVAQKVSALGDRDMIYILAFNRDRDDHFISYVDGIRMVRNAARVPVYGSWGFYFGNGIVGGMITSGFYQGQQAARLGEQILEGRPAAQIPIITRSPNRYMFDYNEMTRFDINPSNLPNGSFLINRPPGFYQRYKWIILSFLILISTTALVLVWRLAAQRRKAVNLKRLNIELDRRVAEQTHTLQGKNRLLEKEIAERKQAELALTDKTHQLEEALAQIKTLNGMLPICANCKKIRDDQGYWNQLEAYLGDHSDATFSHCICPECFRRLYPELESDESP